MPQEQKSKETVKYLNIYRFSLKKIQYKNWLSD